MSRSLEKHRAISKESVDNIMAANARNIFSQAMSSVQDEAEGNQILKTFLSGTGWGNFLNAAIELQRGGRVKGKLERAKARLGDNPFSDEVHGALDEALGQSEKEIGMQALMDITGIDQKLTEGAIEQIPLLGKIYGKFKEGMGDDYWDAKNIKKGQGRGIGKFGSWFCSKVMELMTRMGTKHFSK